MATLAKTLYKDLHGYTPDLCCRLEQSPQKLQRTSLTSHIQNKHKDFSSSLMVTKQEQNVLGRTTSDS